MKQIIPHRFSRRWLGVGMSLITVLAVKASTDVVFQIDMGAASPSTVYIRGSFNGWGTGNPLINTSGTIWSNTVTITDPPGTVEYCKFYYDPGANWENDPNRAFALSSDSPQVLPLQTWNVNTFPSPTNQVTFQVDMSAQVLLGNFTNGDVNSTITVSGDFEGWNAGLPLTNNPTTGDITSNLYTGTFESVGFPGQVINYKFRMNGGWESPASTGGNNRQGTLSNNNLLDPTGLGLFGPNVLPLVYYNDNSINDLVQTPITVTFSLFMTNGTPDETGVPFVKGADHIYINGDFLGWWSWVVGGIGGGYTSADEMVEVGSSDVYTNSFVIPRGNSIYVNYKYSVDGYDTENGFATNHLREIRSYPPTYSFPQDVWSWSVLQPGMEPYPNPGITSTNIQEPDFGYLTIGAPAAGKFPIAWLGRPGVVLQNKSSLSGGVLWNDNLGTDATQSTNWPNGGSAQFFRLKKNQ